MEEMLLNGAYQTDGLVSIAKPMTTDLDGPAGFSSFINASINGVAYPSKALLAQTWNVDMAYAMGEMLGNESLHKEVSGWYAPALNLDRKSTRLNSSHVANSYAVFCLKKKLDRKR